MILDKNAEKNIMEQKQLTVPAEIMEVVSGAGRIGHTRMTND